MSLLARGMVLTLRYAYIYTPETIWRTFHISLTGGIGAGCLFAMSNLILQ